MMKIPFPPIRRQILSAALMVLSSGLSGAATLSPLEFNLSHRSEATRLQLSDSGDILVAREVSGNVSAFRLDRQGKRWTLIQSTWGGDFSLSPSGESMAIIRRPVVEGYDRNYTVQVFSLVGKGNATSVNATTQGQAISVGCSNANIELADKGYLVVTCPDSDDGRGKVDVYVWITGKGEWAILASLAGKNPGDRFGQYVAIDGIRQAHRLFRLSVAATTGVQVFDFDLRLAGGADASVALVLLGTQYLIMGSHPSYSITSLRMSRGTALPILAIGLGTNNTRVLTMNPVDRSWTVAETIPGVAAVLTPDGVRLGLLQQQSEGGTAIGVYKVQSQEDRRYHTVATVAIEPATAWSMNGAGSLIVIADGPQGVQTFVDDTAFCGSPAVSLPVSWITFLERRLCRATTNVPQIYDKGACEDQAMYVAGQAVPCVWVEPIQHFSSLMPSIPPTAPPSTSPAEISMTAASSSTIMPTERPTAASSENDAEAIYGCRCNHSLNCYDHDTPMAYNDPLTICLFGRNIIRLKRLSLVQGERRPGLFWRRVWMYDEDDPALWDTRFLRACGNGVCVISFPMISPLFFTRNQHTDELYSSFVVKSIVLLSDTHRGQVQVDTMVQQGGTRPGYLRGHVSNGNEEKLEISFDVPLTPASLVIGDENSRSGSATSSRIPWMVTGGIVIVLASAAAIFYRKRLASQKRKEVMAMGALTFI